MPRRRPAPTSPLVRRTAALVGALTLGLAGALAGAAPAPALTDTGPRNWLTTRPLYADPSSSAAQTAAATSGTTSSAAARLAAVPQARWVAPADGLSHVQAYLDAAAAKGQLPVLVLYGIPNRDCGGYSSRGGAADRASYTSWVSAVRATLGGRPTVVVLEPDALANGGCSGSNLTEQLATLASAVDVLAQDPRTSVYLDAGHEDWLSPAEAARRLTAAHVASARGFSLDVANSYTTAKEVAYGQQVVAALGGKRFVVDTSRNGGGPPKDLAWCNPPGLLAGSRPQGVTGTAGLDGYLWVKHPGESDGPCNGGPSSGQWFTSWANDFVSRSVAAGRL